MTDDDIEAAKQRHAEWLESKKREARIPWDAKRARKLEIENRKLQEALASGGIRRVRRVSKTSGGTEESVMKNIHFDHAFNIGRLNVLVTWMSPDLAKGAFEGSWYGPRLSIGNLELYVRLFGLEVSIV